MGETRHRARVLVPTVRAAAAIAAVVTSILAGAPAAGAASRASASTAPPVPVVTGISPNVGPLTGNTVVTVQGWGFTQGDTVSFGATVVPASDVSVLLPNTIIVLAPPGPPGTVPVTVTSGGSGSAWGNRFTYSSDPVPACTAASLTGGADLCIDTPRPGGTLLDQAAYGGFGLTIQGSVSWLGGVFAPTSGVHFAQVCDTACDSWGQDTVSPTGPVTGSFDRYRGILRLTVPILSATWGGGVGFRTTGTAFVQAILTKHAASSIPGAVQYSGTLSGDLLDWGGAAWSVPIDVFVAAAAGPGAQLPPAPPVVLGVSPDSGTTAGGTIVRVRGFGFGPDATVSLGSVPLRIVDWVSPNEVYVVTQTAPAGVADIRVTSAGLTSLVTPLDRFTSGSGTAPSCAAAMAGTSANVCLHGDIPWSGGNGPTAPEPFTAVGTWRSPSSFFLPQPGITVATANPAGYDGQADLQTLFTQTASATGPLTGTFDPGSRWLDATMSLEESTGLFVYGPMLCRADGTVRFQGELAQAPVSDVPGAVEYTGTATVPENTIGGQPTMWASITSNEGVCGEGNVDDGAPVPTRTFPVTVYVRGG